MYHVSYVKGRKRLKLRFPRELIEVMLNQINEAPDSIRNYPGIIELASQHKLCTESCSSCLLYSFYAHPYF